MTEVSRNLRNVFFTKYPRFWNLKSDFFPIEKSFSQIFENTANFFHLEFISIKVKKKIREPFLSHFTFTFTSLSRLECTRKSGLCLSFFFFFFLFFFFFQYIFSLSYFFFFFFSFFLFFSFIFPSLSFFLLSFYSSSEEGLGGHESRSYAFVTFFLFPPPPSPFPFLLPFCPVPVPFPVPVVFPFPFPLPFLFFFLFPFLFSARLGFFKCWCWIFIH